MVTTTVSKLQRQIESINCWSRGSQRAPHKPLLLLLSLAGIEHKVQRLTNYKELQPQLLPLLREFGPTRSSHHPEYPFWRLQNDREIFPFWEVENSHLCSPRKGHTDAKKSELLKFKIRGGFNESAHRILDKNLVLRKKLIAYLLTENFPDSLHSEILSALGLDKEYFLIDVIKPQRRARDASFRKEVLKNYQYQCAICRASIRINDKTIGIEAAHIKWHQANGPDQVSNGIALCALHHKLFDFGAFTLEQKDCSTILLISDETSGQGLAQWLEPYLGRTIKSSRIKENRPNSEFLNWHRKEVFKGVAIGY